MPISSPWRLKRLVSAVPVLLLLVARSAQAADNVPIPYTAADGTSHPLAAQTNGSVTTFQSQPAIDGVPVRAATPMPVVIEPGPSVTGASQLVDAGGVNKATVTAAGQLETNGQPNNSAGAYDSPAVVGTTATTLVAANTAKTFLDIQNGCTTQNMTVLVGGNTARVLTPLATFTREGAYVPSDAITATVPTGTCSAYVGVK